MTRKGRAEGSERFSIYKDKHEILTTGNWPHGLNLRLYLMSPPPFPLLQLCAPVFTGCLNDTNFCYSVFYSNFSFILKSGSRFVMLHLFIQYVGIIRACQNGFECGYSGCIYSQESLRVRESGVMSEVFFTLDCVCLCVLSLIKVPLEKVTSIKA